MEYFIQQLVNGITLGSIYGLIAIGYTMVYGIIGMINFAHDDIFMIGAFVALISFIIGSSLASVAGMMFVLYYGVIDFYIGFLAGIKAFTAAVLGGIGSLPGAMLGGLLIGLIETFWAGYVSLEYKDVAAFSVLIVVLIFFPTGFLGKPDIEKV